MMFNTSKGLSSTTLFDDWLNSQFLAGTPVQVTYKLAEPAVYDLKSSKIELLSGVNNLYSNSGQISAEYSVYEKWTTKCPLWSKTYRHYFTCTQIKFDNDTYKWTDPVGWAAYDDITGIIDEIEDIIGEVSDSSMASTAQIAALQEAMTTLQTSSVFNSFTVESDGVHIKFKSATTGDTGEIYMDGANIVFRINGADRAYINSAGFNFDYGILTTALTIGKSSDGTDTDGEWTWMKANSGHFRLVYKGS